MTVIGIKYGSAKRLNEIAKNYFYEIDNVEEQHASETEENTQTCISVLSLVGKERSTFDVDKFLSDVCNEFLGKKVEFKKSKTGNYWDNQVYRFEENTEEETFSKFIQVIYKSKSFSGCELTVYFKVSEKK